MGGMYYSTCVAGSFAHSFPCSSNCRSSAACLTLSASALSSGSFPVSSCCINSMSSVKSRIPLLCRCCRQSWQCHGPLLCCSGILAHLVPPSITPPAAQHVALLCPSATLWTWCLWILAGGRCHIAAGCLQVCHLTQIL